MRSEFLRFGISLLLALVAAPRSLGALTGGVFDPTFSVPVPPEAESGIIAITGDIGRAVTFQIWGNDKIPFGTLGYEERLALRTNGTVAKWLRGTNSAPNHYGEYQNYQVLRPAKGQALGVVPSYPDVLLTSDGWLEAESPIDVGSGISLTPTSDETAYIAVAGSNDIEPGSSALGQTKTHLVALRKNGAVVELTSPVKVPLAAQSGVQAIAAGTNYSVALRTDGSVVAWTFPGGTPIATHTALQSRVQSITADTNAFAALLTDGTLVFQKLDGSADLLPAPSDGILASGTPSFALTTDHRALTWDGSKWKPANVPGWTQGRLLGRYDSSLLVLEGAPIIKRQPASRTVFEGRPLDLSVDGGGPGAKYQWLKNGTNIANATNDVLHLDPEAAPFTGAYTVVITNRAGSITSAPPAQVTMAPAPASGFLSVSSDREASTPLTTIQTAFGFSHSLYLYPEGLVAAKFTGPLFTTDDRTGLLRRSSQNWGQWIVPPEALTGVVEIYAGGYSSLARKADGTLIYWGDAVPYGTALVSPPSNVRSIASGSLDWMLTNDGGVVRWDRTRNVFTQDGVPEAAQSGVRQLINYNLTAALKTDGTVVQLGTKPVPPEVQSGVAAFTTLIGSPLFHVAALWAKTDGSLFTWGYDGVIQPFAAKIPNVVEISSTTSYFDLNRSFPAAMAVRTADGKAYYVRAEDPNPTPVTIPSSWLGRIVSFSMTENGSAISAVLREGTQPQSIQFVLPDSVTYSPTPLTLTGRASSELPVSYRVLDGPASVIGNQLTLTGTGAVTIVAEQPGNANWTPAVPLQRTFTILKADQSIQFAAIPSQPFTANPISLVASSSSGLPVALRVVNGPATLNGNQLLLTGVGDVTLAAEQAGTATWNAATPVTRSFTVSKVSQSIQFALPESHPFSDTPIPLTATSSSGLEVFFSVFDGPGKIVGKALQPTGTGFIIVLAVQLGTPTINEASAIKAIFITSAPQQISFPPLESVTFGGPAVSVSATASSGLPVQFSVLDGPGVIEDGALRATGVGTIRVVARQPGNAIFTWATDVIQSVLAIPQLDLLLSPQVGGFGALRVVLPSGQTAVIEQSDSLGIWTSIGPVFGFGANTPLFLSLTSSPSDTTARFWRVRVP